MAPSTQSDDADLSDDGPPRLTVCERSPGTLVFLERGNTDGWIATDLVVDSRR